MITKRRNAVLSALVLSLVGCASLQSCATTAGPATPVPSYQIGDRWTYQAHGTINRYGSQAASGVTVTETLGTAVTVGMSATEVEQILGRPAHIVSYPSAPGPTWSYNVVGAPFGITEFDVGFGSDGKVVDVGTRILGGGGK